MLISVDNASVLSVSFYKMLKALSVPLEFSYLAIVLSLYPCPFGKGRERLPENRLKGEGYKTVNKKMNVKMSKGGCFTKKERSSFCLQKKTITLFLE